jgi:hypothetical protein
MEIHKSFVIDNGFKLDAGNNLKHFGNKQYNNFRIFLSFRGRFAAVPDEAISQFASDCLPKLEMT